MTLKSKPHFIIVIDHAEGTISLGNDDIGLIEFQASDPASIEWSEDLQGLLEESGFIVEFAEEN